MSLAVGVLNTGVAGHSIVAAAPTPEIVGLLWSSTVMVWLAVLRLPQASVAVQVRVTLLVLMMRPPPRSTPFPCAAVFRSSLAVGALNTGVAGHSIVAAAPTPEMLGLLWSSTVMVWLAAPRLPQASVAVQVRLTV